MALSLPIPNRVIKRRTADDTRKGTVGSRQLKEINVYSKKIRACGFFIWLTLSFYYRISSSDVDCGSGGGVWTHIADEESLLPKEQRIKRKHFLEKNAHLVQERAAIVLPSIATNAERSRLEESEAFYENTATRDLVRRCRGERMCKCSFTWSPLVIYRYVSFSS